MLKTVAEIGNAGFNLYTTDAIDIRFSRINANFTGQEGDLYIVFVII